MEKLGDLILGFLLLYELGVQFFKFQFVLLIVFDAISILPRERLELLVFI